ncbi:MAG: ECF transporter S component [Candidatus Thorarchaeota archaeon SMTZ1-45]
MIDEEPLLSTRDIVTIAILGSLGGALSTFVGYLGNLINLTLGVPFGAGQFMAGLHVFWIVLMRVIVPRSGVGTAGGLLKGLVEMFTGSTHGVVIVIVSLIQGAIVDGAAFLGGNPKNNGTISRLVWWFGAGISSASNVIVFQLLYFSGVPILYIALIATLAFCSGVIFAGFFAWETLEFLNDTGVMSYAFLTSRSPARSRRSFVLRNFPAIALVLFLTLGSTFYVVTVARTFADPFSCEVMGLVESPYVFQPSAFTGQEVTIEAELIGAYTHIPPANYSGYLVSTILLQALPQEDASSLRIVARDGYTALFDLYTVMNDPRFLLTEADDGLWLIAGDYDGSLWVRMVTRLEVG